MNKILFPGSYRIEYDVQSIPSREGGGFLRVNFDLDGNGYTDFLMADGVFPPSPNRPTTGDIIYQFEGAFHLSSNEFSGTTHPRELVLGDFNRDDVVDFFIAAHGYDAPPFLGERNVLAISSENGYIDTQVDLTASDSFTHSAAVGDIDGDGDLDILEVNLGDPWAVLYLNDGNGFFSNYSHLLPRDLPGQPPTFHSATSSLIHDIDGDGISDIIFGSQHSFEWGPSRIYFGTDDENFLEKDSLLLHDLTLNRNNQIIVDIQAFDIDLDGDDDLVTSYTLNDPFYTGAGIQVFRNDGNREFTDVSWEALSGENFNVIHTWVVFLEVLDFNGDGVLDIYLVRPGGLSSEPLVFLGDGGGKFYPLLGSDIIADRNFEFLLSNTLPSYRDGNLELAGAQYHEQEYIISRIIIEQPAIVQLNSKVSTDLIGGRPEAVNVSVFVTSRSGVALSDVMISINDGTELVTVKSDLSRASAVSIASGSNVGVAASLSYDASSKSITSQDALDALRLSVGFSTSVGSRSSFDFISADFNRDGKVTSSDALEILKYSVGLPTQNSPEWIFIDSNYDFSDWAQINLDETRSVFEFEVYPDVTINLTGILVGDVNASFSAVVNSTRNFSPTGSPFLIGAAGVGNALTLDLSSIVDADGLGVFSYQWETDGVVIEDATSDIYTITQNDVGKTITAVISYIDGSGNLESLRSNTSNAILNVNHSATGSLIIRGAAVVGEELSLDTSAIADVDGLGEFSYYWKKDGKIVLGAAEPSYTLTNEDKGFLISASVSYVDGNGTTEILTVSTADRVVGKDNEIGTNENLNDNQNRNNQHTVTFFETYHDFDPNGPPTDTMTITAARSTSPASGNTVIIFQTNEFRDDGRKLTLLEFDSQNFEFVDASSQLSADALSGAVRKIATGDLNSDGVNDFAFAINREDVAENYGENGVNWQATPQVFISNTSKAKFELISFGQEKYYHSVDVFVADNGKTLVALDDGSFWRFDEPLPVQERMNMIESIQNPIYGVADGKSFTVGMRYIGGETRSGVDIELILGRQDANGDFVQVGKYSFDAVDAKFYQNASTVVMAAPTINVSGIEYFSFGYMQFEKFEDIEAGLVYIAAKNSLQRVGDVKGYTDNTSSFQLEGSGVPIYEQVGAGQIIDIFVVIGNDLSRIDANFSDSQMLQENFNFFKFGDLDMDGDPDIVAYAINKEPLIYLNDGAFNFIRAGIGAIIENVSSELFSSGSRTYRLDDFDNNGDLDLLILPGEWVDPAEILFEATLIL